MWKSSRRAFLASAIAGTTILAGCLGQSSAPQPAENPGDATNVQTPGEAMAADAVPRPPTVDRGLPQDYTIEQLLDESRSGGPPPDGIPSVDDPKFNAADNPPGNLGPNEPVFGVSMNGETKAYPQYNLVYHEIVNDTFGDDNVAVTYCPLTGTAQGFYRGDVEFGVSGQLINSNLVMFDRANEGWWPQMLALGIQGPQTGEYLDEFQVIWTTWERWRGKHPDSLVLNENTGHARNYGSDPYGSYNPLGGYYDNNRTLFPPLTSDDTFHPKDVVLGARTRDGAVAVPKQTIREKPVITGTVGDVPYVTVYDNELDTAFAYRNPDDITVSAANGEYSVDGDPYAPADLPLERVIAYDAFWLAWFGYYPSTVIHE